MSGELKLSFIIEAIDRASSVVEHITDRLAKPAQAIGRLASAATERLEQLGSSYSGIAAMVGGGLEIKGLVDEDSFFRRIGALSGAAASDVEDLRHALYDQAIAARISHGELVGAFEAFRGNGGMLQSFKSNLDSVSAAIALLGGNGAEVGVALATMQKSFELTDPKEFAKGLATIVEQLHDVRGGFEGFATNAAALSASYSALGHRGTEAAKELGAVYAVVAQGAKSPLQAGRYVGELMDKLAKPQSRDAFQGATGIETGGRNGRPIVSLPNFLTAISQRLATEGGQYNLSGAGGLSMQLLDAIKVAREEAAKGGATTLQAKLAVEGDPAAMMERAQKATEGLSGALTRLKTTIDKFAESNLTRPFEVLANVLEAGNGIVAGFITTLGGLAIGGAALSWMKNIGSSLGVWSAIGAATGYVGDFILALRAGYPVMIAFNLALAANPVGAVIVGLTALAGVAVLIYEKWEPIKNFFEHFGDFIPDWLKRAFNGAGMAEVNALGLNLPPETRPSDANPDAAAGDSAAVQHKVGGEVVVRFENPPPGTKVSKMSSANPDVPIDAYMGWSMMGAGVP